VNEYNKLFEGKDYNKKVERLKERLLEEYKIWAMKTKYVDRLRNVEKDVDFIKVIQSKKHMTQLDKDNIDRLMKKYNL
jgi:DNA-binding transcriptional regulator WhiA